MRWVEPGAVAEGEVWERCSWVKGCGRGLRLRGSLGLISANLCASALKFRSLRLNRGIAVQRVAEGRRGFIFSAFKPGLVLAAAWPCCRRTTASWQGSM